MIVISFFLLLDAVVACFETSGNPVVSTTAQSEPNLPLPEWTTISQGTFFLLVWPPNNPHPAEMSTILGVMRRSKIRRLVFVSQATTNPQDPTARMHSYFFVTKVPNSL